MIETEVERVLPLGVGLRDEPALYEDEWSGVYSPLSR